MNTLGTGGRYSISLMVTTLSNGSAVQVLETGAMQTIDGITAPWVKVLSESGGIQVGAFLVISKQSQKKNL